MVTIRSLVVLYATVGIASAGKCKPGSYSSSGSVSFSTTETTSAFVSAVGSSTTAPGTTLETSIKESTSETAFNAISTDTTETATPEPSLTTLLTSLVTTSADTITTTDESAATATSATPITSCPSDTEQCFNTMKIKCKTVIGGLNGGVVVKDLNECVQQCGSNVNCAGFTYQESNQVCG
ncbi:hypothetical protein FSPOR_9007 [Fusarium sporotrichioides]|uniref:Apple domain-containing protein n=1 Tax=Fusarium sporotrichioides TaxID=5514 RepID=A0A395RRP8_FUSSP|nr:hypothetical protein FSPOR_9007 [Fusarium sporotrichioides]